MQLSPDLFEQVVSLVEARPLAGAEPEQRSEPRLGLSTRVMIVPFSKQIVSVPFSVCVRDVAPGGIGLLHTQKIPLDEQFVILLPGVQTQLAILCTVAYWQPLPDGQFAIGAKFTRILRESQVQDARADAQQKLSPAPAAKSA